MHICRGNAKSQLDPAMEHLVGKKGNSGVSNEPE